MYSVTLLGEDSGNLIWTTPNVPFEFIAFTLYPLVSPPSESSNMEVVLGTLTQLLRLGL